MRAFKLHGVGDQIDVGQKQGELNFYPGHIGVDLAEVFVAELIDLQFHQHMAFQDAVIDHQIDKAARAADQDAFYVTAGLAPSPRDTSLIISSTCRNRSEYLKNTDSKKILKLPAQHAVSLFIGMYLQHVVAAVAVLAVPSGCSNNSKSSSKQLTRNQAQSS